MWNGDQLRSEPRIEGVRTTCYSGCKKVWWSMVDSIWQLGVRQVSKHHLCHPTKAASRGVTKGVEVLCSTSLLR